MKNDPIHDGSAIDCPRCAQVRAERRQRLGWFILYVLIVIDAVLFALVMVKL